MVYFRNITTGQLDNYMFDGEAWRHYEAFAEYGCVTEKNFDALLADIDDSHMEMKAFFMKYKEETLGYQDFFEGLSFEL